MDGNVSQVENSNKKSNVRKEIMSWIWTILLALGIALLLRTFVFEHIRVPTRSMVSTINVNDTLFVNKFIYQFKPIKRGDIAEFRYPDNPSVRYVKRVIGIPGDVIEIKDGKLILNGEAPVEPYILETMRKENAGPFTVPENHYFMMGDNRNDSLDSRYWVNKYVSKDAILGKVIFRFLPLSRAGIMK